MIKKLDVPIWPVADEREEAKLRKILKSGSWWRNTGTEVKKFEKEFSEYQGCKSGITVSNGTQALEIALKALDIGAGDEVIVPDFTFYSTISAVLNVNAIPVIVDVEKDTYCIDPKQIRKAITNKTKAIIPVHIAGNLADMTAICKIAEEHKLFIIEDASHAHGAFLDGKGAGSFGTLGIFSFQNAKLMTAGEGGIIIGHDKEILEKAFLLSNCGRAENDSNYQHLLLGTNARLSEFQGAILRVQLERLSEQIYKRETNYRYLEECFSKIPGVILQKHNPNMTINPHYMIMFYYEKNAFKGVSRTKFIQYLRKFGIPCNRSYESLHKLPVLKTIPKNNFRIVSTTLQNGKIGCMNSERISKTVVCLNHNILLKDKKLVENITEIIKDLQIK